MEAVRDIWWHSWLVAKPRLEPEWGGGATHIRNGNSLLETGQRGNLPRQWEDPRPGRESQGQR